MFFALEFLHFLIIYINIFKTLQQVYSQNFKKILTFFKENFFLTLDK